MRLPRPSILVLATLVLLGAGLIALFVQGQSSARSATVHVLVRGPGGSAEATLRRQADRWIGAVADFPGGSVSHVQPSENPGFFLVHGGGATWRAYADQSLHRGEPLDYRDPLPGSAGHADGPQPGFFDPAAATTFTLDGELFAGPAPRPLDPFPLAVDGDRLEIRTHAVCPADLVNEPAWRGDSVAGPRMLPAGQAVVLLPPDAPLEVFSEPGLRAGADPRRRMTAEELRAAGFDVVDRASDLARLTDARVVWVPHDALGAVDPAWARARYAECRAVGVLDGTIGDLADHFGIAANDPSWIQSGGVRPVFAVVRKVPCPNSALY